MIQKEMSTGHSTVHAEVVTHQFHYSCTTFCIHAMSEEVEEIHNLQNLCGYKTFANFFGNNKPRVFKMLQILF